MYAVGVLSHPPRVVPATTHHIEVCRDWISRRGLPMPPDDVFSSTGFVVEGVAAVWLYITNSTMAYLDHLIGNPDVAREERSAGLDAVITKALVVAHALGRRLAVAMVDNPAVERRLVRLGLSVTGRELSYMSANLGAPTGGRPPCLG